MGHGVGVAANGAHPQAQPHTGCRDTMNTSHRAGFGHDRIGRSGPGGITSTDEQQHSDERCACPQRARQGKLEGEQKPPDPEFAFSTFHAGCTLFGHREIPLHATVSICTEK